jgi:O-antigen/teichoic acid export membrane protein
LSLVFGCASIVVLLLLRSHYSVSIELAFAALALAALPSLVLFLRVALQMRVSLLRDVEIGQLRREGHLVAGNLLGWANQQGVTYIVAALLTPYSVGILGAVRNLFAPIGVLLLSLESFLPGRMAYVVRRHGPAVMWRQVLVALAVSAVLMAGAATAFVEYGRVLVVWLYGPAFVEAYSIPLLLSFALIYLFALTSQVLSVAARVQQQLRQIVAGRLAALATLIASALVFVPLFGIQGAGASLAAADFVCAAWLAVSLYKYARA